MTGQRMVNKSGILDPGAVEINVHWWPLIVRSTNLESWTQEQLKLMSIGGHGQAGLFFKTLRLDRRVPDFPSVSSFKEISLGKDADSGTGNAELLATDYFIVEQLQLNPVPVVQSAAPVIRKPIAIGTRKTPGAKLGSSLGVRKLASKGNDGIYDQKQAELPPEPAPPAPSSVTLPVSQILYLEDQETDCRPMTSSGASGHVLAPQSGGDFFTEF